MKKSWLLLAILVLGVVAVAARAPAEEEEGEHEEVEMLERNVRMDFKLVPLEEGDEGVFVVAASSWYRSSTRYEGEDVRIVFEVAGSIDIVEKKRVFATYEGHVEMEGDDQEAEFHINSSALLTVGEELEVARMGEKTLVMRATFVE